MSVKDKSIMAPELTDVMYAVKRDIFRTLNAVKIGTIQSFNGTKKTAVVNLVFKRNLPNGTIQNYPVLVDCPVFTLQGGGAGIECPIAVGDTCLLLFADRNIDAWFKTGGQSAPLTTRCHDLSDAIALVGLNASTSSFQNYDATKLKLFFNGGTISINSTGNISLIGAGGAEIDLNAALVSIKNGATTLLNVINGLITVIEGISTVPGGGPLNAASISALEAYKTVVGTLLS